MTKYMVSAFGALILMVAATGSLHAESRLSLASPVTQGELDTVIGKSKRALDYLDKFWGDVFRASGKPYSTPGIKTMSSGHAYYQADDHTIYINPTFFVERMRAAAEQTGTDGDMAFIVILAHEYAHSVQRQLGMMNGDSRSVELQADRMAGAFAAASRDEGLLDPGDLDEATFTFFTGRDQTGTKSADAHGNGTERVAAFHSGLKGGVRAALQR